MACINKKLSLVDTCNQMAKEGKVLGEQVDTFIKYVSRNKEYSGVSWFFLIMFDNWGKGIDELRALMSQLKIM